MARELQMTRSSSRGGVGALISRLAAGVPERFAKPRIMLIVAVFALVSFGLLMIYSSSSIVALTSEDYNNDATYFVVHQLIFAGAGTVVAVILASLDYHVWSDTFLVPIWIVTMLMLGLVMFSSSGTDAYGATRWIAIGPFTLQPSEFAKVTVVLVGATLCRRHFEEGLYDQRTFLLLLALGVALPLALVVFQPDKGTTIICISTLLVMLYLSGVPGRTIAIIGVVGVLAFFAYSMKDAYSRQRILTLLDPWVDPWGSGYQLIQGFYAFGSGGLLGMGIGSSRQKYSYLPMAYNDFIYAVVGEECGLVGTLGVLVGFAVVVWAGFRIARYAPDLAGRLIAAGSVSMLAIQLFVNIGGVLGLIPLTGKPVPFLSYGGSSIISSLMLVGLVVSVSRASRLEETDSDRRRRDMSVLSRPRAGAIAGEDRSSSTGVSEPKPKSRSSRPSLQLVEGGVSSSRDTTKQAGSDVRSRSDAAGSRQSKPKARVTTDANGRRRIDLGPSAAERLRSRGRSTDRSSQHQRDRKDARRGR